MTVEAATYISDLDITNPTAADPKSQGDDHLRLLKSCLKNTFPNITGPVLATQAQLVAAAGIGDSTDPLKGDALLAVKQPLTGAIARTQHDKNTESLNVDDFGATGGNVVADTAGVLAAIAAGGGRTIEFSAKTYHLSAELLITVGGTILKGAGKGYLRNLQPFDVNARVPVTRLLFVGSGTKSIKTRVNYRGSVIDPSDAPMATGINIQADGVTIQDLMVELNCDYSNASPSNLGDDWDVGIFHGSRQDLRLIDVNVMGYWRKASIWLDSTRAHNLPELNGYPATFGTGADGITLERVNVSGGFWGIKKQGPRPKPGLGHFGHQYKRAAKFVFSGQPVAGDTASIDGVVYAFRAAAVTRFDVTIGANVAATITNLAAKITAQMPLIPYDLLTLIPSASELAIYSITSAATAMADTSANIAVQTIGGSAATQTETITDPALFFDSVSGLVADARGALGASDFIVNDGTICSIQHHSFRRMTDIAASPNPDTDPAAGALFVDGLGGSGLVHRQYFNCNRFQSCEPFCVKLGYVGRARFNDGCFEAFDARWTSTAGAALTTADTYGRIAGVAAKSALLQVIGYDDPGSYFPLGVNSNQVYSHFYLDGHNSAIRNDLTVGKLATIGLDNTEVENGALTIKGGESANAELRFDKESIANTGRIRVSNSGVMTLATRVGGSGALTDRFAMFDSGNDSSNHMRPDADGAWSIGSGTRKWTNLWANQMNIIPPATANPSNNGEVNFALTSNTLLTIRVRGLDGVIRSGTIALA